MIVVWEKLTVYMRQDFIGITRIIAKRKECANAIFAPPRWATGIFLQWFRHNGIVHTGTSQYLTSITDGSYGHGWRWICLVEV